MEIVCAWPEYGDDQSVSGWPHAEHAEKEKRIAQATLFFVYIAFVGITNQVFMAPQTLITCPLT